MMLCVLLKQHLGASSFYSQLSFVCWYHFIKCTYFIVAESCFVLGIFLWQISHSVVMFENKKLDYPTIYPKTKNFSSKNLFRIMYSSRVVFLRFSKTALKPFVYSFDKFVNIFWIFFWFYQTGGERNWMTCWNWTFYKHCLYVMLILATIIDACCCN